MGTAANIVIAQALFASVGVGALPWIDHRICRQSAAKFFADLRRLTEPVQFEVEDILASDNRAVIVAALVTRVQRTDRSIKSAFTIILTIAGLIPIPGPRSYRHALPRNN